MNSTNFLTVLQVGRPMGIDDSKVKEWEAKQAANAQRNAEMMEQPELPLKGGSGGGTSGPMVPLKDYVDARDEAVESRLLAKLDALPTTSTLWATAATIVGVILAAMAFGGDRFDSGIGMADQRQEQLQRDARQDKAVSEMNGKLDVLINREQPSANR
jgi:hypothetical protein